ncbi:MAG: translation elongation factor Ts [Helicobacter sp.]|nr:translation elongation factor Ts [Helicobacter sp.]
MISAQLVKQLREMTDAGMMDCKNALVECNGDIDKAVSFLREKGLSKAAKKADRIAAEGVISMKLSPDLSSGVLLEINSETDFAAKNDLFKNLVQKTTDLVFTNNIKDPEQLDSAQIDGAKFQDFLHEQISKIGENIKIRKIKRLDTSACSCNPPSQKILNGYIHSNNKVGVLILARFKNEQNKEKIATLVRNLCMHAAAMKPVYICHKGFSPEFIAAEKAALKGELEKQNEENARLGKPKVVIPEYVSRAEITDEVLAKKEEELKQILREQKKPEAIWDKILPGQIDRFLADNTILDSRLTLLGQFYVMDDKKTIADVLKNQSEELNDNIEILDYIRFELGEGIEKKDEDFASEVAAQIK